MRRGLTLIELIAALALLGTLSTVAVSWTTSAARLAADEGARRRWLAAADETLRLVADDLRGLIPPALAPDDADPVVVEDGELRLHARAVALDGDARPHAAVGIAYALDRGLLTRRVGGEIRPLLTDVRRFHARLLSPASAEDPEHDDRRRWLALSIQGPDAIAAERVYRIPDAPEPARR